MIALTMTPSAAAKLLGALSYAGAAMAVRAEQKVGTPAAIQRAADSAEMLHWAMKRLSTAREDAGPKIVTALSVDAVGVIAGLVADGAEINSKGITAPADTWREIRTMFPPEQFLSWAQAHPDAYIEDAE